MRFTSLAAPACAVALAALAIPTAALADHSGDRAKRDKAAFFDSRSTPGAKKVLAARDRARAARPDAAVTALKRSLGTQGIVDVDALTGTARFVGRLDGFITGPSPRDPADIALDYIRNHKAVFGADRDSINGLELRKDYVSIDGTHHLFFEQTVSGVPVFANGIRANITSAGQIINFTGSPVASLAGAAAAPAISATQAIVAARRNAEQPIASVSTSGDAASLVYFASVNGLRLAWRTQIYGADSAYQSVVDAQTGKILYRNSLVDYANGLAWDNYPGAPVGGTQQPVSLTGWLTSGATTLTGANAHAYSDVDDSNAPDAGEEVTPTDAAGNFNYAFQPFGTPPFGNTINSDCTAAYLCSWDSSFPTGVSTPGFGASWKVNRAQNAVQAFVFVNRFHDHLAAPPIGFTADAGAFQGDDPVLVEPDDGAGVISGLFPDPLHTDNANMATPPDGTSPRMQMYLFNDPVASDPIFGGVARSDPFVQGNGGDEADVVYHEYGHGLSNRLVVDASGNSTLGNGQAGSMGEAWSDWYAMDYLVDTGQFTDTATDGELRVGEYVGAGQDLIRTQPMDCPVGSTSPACHGTAGAGPGGYTYGDFGKIIGRPEVHADGEIWGETLWDLRNAIGVETTEGLVTRAMELSPSNPSFLDMRNSIVQADLVDFGGSHGSMIWQVFAHRGMGYFAAAVDGDDVQPVEDFSMPPTGKPNGSLRGTVTDQDTNQPIQGIVVQFGGHNSGFTGTLADLSDKKGKYKIDRVFRATYQKISASGAGYDPVVKSATVGSGTKLDFALRRDWASLSGGGSIAAFNGPDFTGFGCGPSSAIDQSETNGWGSTTDGDDGVATGNVTPKFIVVKLPRAVDVSEIQVNPSNTCGDGGSAATRGWRVEVSSDGTTFTELGDGVFYLGNRAMENTVFTGTANDVLYVKFWMLNPQVPTAPTPPGGALPACTGPADCGTDPDSNAGVALHCTPPSVDAFGGCQFMDMVELKVFGRPTA